jgi:hypothetical protein
MKEYNKRTWLNKDTSPSLGSVVAFDGEVKYSDATERTTFLAISDCRYTIKLIKNTETIEDFIEKMKLIKSEIEQFINHLETKNMDNEISRRNRLDLCTPAELAIFKAMEEVEKIGADVKLTDAIIKLQEARNLVADFIDGKSA